MKTLTKLPKGFKEICKVDLQNDKKAVLIVNGISLLVVAAMIVPMLFIVPIGDTYDFGAELWFIITKLATTTASALAYLSLHELVHGVVMKFFGAKKIKYGFTGLYACASSNDYYAKIPYITVALAPIVLWGIVLTIICIFVPEDWFWIPYFIQVVNISGASGDIFVSCKLLKMPKDVLVYDKGTAMTVYSEKK